MLIKSTAVLLGKKKIFILVIKVESVRSQE